MTPITWQAAVDDAEQRPLLQDILEAAVDDWRQAAVDVGEQRPQLQAIFEAAYHLGKSKRSCDTAHLKSSIDLFLSVAPSTSVETSSWSTGHSAASLSVYLVTPELLQLRVSRAACYDARATPARPKRSCQIGSKSEFSGPRETSSG